jgi:hypothetical protein
MAMVERLQGYEAGMHDYLGAVTQGQESERARLAASCTMARSRC